MYLAKRSPPILQLLIEWVFITWRCHPTVCDRINSRTAIIRSNMNQGAKAPLTTLQRQRLQHRIAEAIVAASEEPA